MSIKKSLLGVAVLAIAMMGFASSALAAEDGTVKDVETGLPIAAGTTLHFVGWAKFEGELGSVECHVTSIAKATNGSTGTITNFSVPNVANCKVAVLGCTLKSVTADNLPYHLTATKTDFDVTDGTPVGGGPIRITNVFEGSFCLIKGTSSLTFPEITLKPLKTGERTVTNTSKHLGLTANPGEPIAGVELSGEGTLDKPSGAKEAIIASGELELSEATKRCTYKLE